MNSDSLTEQRPVTTEGLAQQKLTRELSSSLDPAVVVDEEGNSRTIFSLPTKRGAVMTMFYSPGELPVIKTEAKSVYIFGNKPVQRPKEEWEQFLGKIASKSGYGIVDSTLFNNHLLAHTVEDIQEGRAGNMILAETSPLHLLDLCLALGIDEKRLKSLRDAFSSRRLGFEATEFIDQIIAGKIIDDQGNFRKSPNYEGEVLTILSVLGDEQAKRLSEQRLQQLRVSDQERDAQAAQIYLKQMENPAAQISREGLKPEQLVLVHVTRYLPQARNGNLEISSTFDESKWELPRNTLHFTLNHPVQSHFYGSWDDVPYAIIAPFKQVNEINGNPVMLSTVDTIYEVSPGVTLKLPEGTVVVKPGLHEEGRLWSLDGNEVTYKGRNLTPDDFRTFVTEVIGNNERRRFKFNDKITKWIESAFRSDRDKSLSYQEINLLCGVLGGPQGTTDIIQLLEQEPLWEVLEKLLASANLAQKCPDSLKKELVGLVEGIFIASIKDTAIRRKISAMGYPVFPGADSPHSDFTTYGASLILAAEMGIPVTSHEHHVTGEISESLAMFLNFQRDPEQRIKYGRPYNKLREDFMKNLSHISQKSRRMVYLLGAI